MRKLIIRHGLSEANNRNNIGTPAFGSAEAPLMAKGVEQAQMLGERLLTEFKIEIDETTVATSEMLRAKQTASNAGFTSSNSYALLNEIERDVPFPEFRKMLDEKRLPDSAYEVAEAILENPPVEEIWFSHGLVIAALSEVLGVAKDQRFVPKFCEIRELPIGN